MPEARDLFSDVSADLLRRGLPLRFRAPGRSMAPAIRDGEMIHVRPIPPSGVRTGDIVLYRCDRGAIAHRVIRIERQRERSRVFIVRGDSSITADAPVEEGRLLGKVVAVERDGGMIDLASPGARIHRALRSVGARLRRAAGIARGRRPGPLPAGKDAATERPEHRLLLACAGASWNSGRSADLEALLAERIDWEVLIPLASKHGLLPLLHWRIGAAGGDGLPRDVRDRLRDAFDANHRRNIFLTGEVCRIIERFKERRVPIVPFRGVALTAAVYEHLALRQFADQDFLVRKDDVPEARDVLASLGYEPLFNEAVDREGFLESECELLFARRSPDVFIEIHWETTPPQMAVDLDHEALWDRLAEDGPAGIGAPSFSPEDTVISLCLHGAKHLWKRLIWISDLARWVDAHRDIRWEQVLREARSAGIERIILLGLCLARDIGGVTVPRAAADRLGKDGTATMLAVRLREMLFVEQDERAMALETFRLHLRMRERRWDRMKCILRVGGKGSAWDRAAGAPLSFLGPLSHLPRYLRLAARYGPLLIRHRGHGKKGR